MFSDTAITGVNPPVSSGVDLYLSWTSTAPAGTNYQVYVDRVLTWYGTTTAAVFIGPRNLDSIIVGTVGPGEASTDFSASLPVAPLRKVLLEWIGGTFEAPDIAGFHVYSSAQPTGWGSGGWGSGPWGGVTLTALLADIQAYTPGVVTDGWGLGGWGLGGWGSSSAKYSWTSDPMQSGTYWWAVIPYDLAGNEGVPDIQSSMIGVPPFPPDRAADNLRLHYSYDASTFEVTLTWLPSPG